MNLETDRKRRMFWIVGTNDMPAYVEGLSCDPTTPDAWWFPTKGYSLHESQCFASREKAVAVAERRLVEQKNAIDALITRLRLPE